ncbi:MAG: hypothetical protein ABJC19_03860 [Gemmatimonadota bacterium]
MRLLLLAALLLRLAPLPAFMASGESHCVRVEASASHHGAAHHQHSATRGPQADCPHCPPSECASQDQCATAPVMVALVTSTAPHSWTELAGSLARGSATLFSIVQSPPTRPPAPRLA